MRHYNFYLACPRSERELSDPVRKDYLRKIWKYIP